MRMLEARAGVYDGVLAGIQAKRSVETIDKALTSPLHELEAVG